MAYAVIIPNLGTIDESAKILRWYKKESDEVRQGEHLVEVETLKADYVVDAEESGYLRKIYHPEGDEVDVREVLGVIAGPGERLPEPRIAGKKQEAGSSPVIKRAADKTPAKVKATPAARKKARELGVDLSVLSAAFPDKILHATDVMEYNEKTASGDKLIIIGASKFGNEILDTIEAIGGFKILGYLDDDKGLRDSMVRSHGVLGPVSMLASLSDVKVAVAVSGTITRKKLFSLVEKAKLDIVSLVDPRAIVSHMASIGRGVVVKPGAVISSNTVIGDGAIIDIGAVVAHNNIVGRFSHLAPGCQTGGTVTIGESTLVGVGSSVASFISIGNNVIISPGSSVLSDVPDGVVVQGNPAKVIGKKR